MTFLLSLFHFDLRGSCNINNTSWHQIPVIRTKILGFVVLKMLCDYVQFSNLRPLLENFFFSF